jgi:hypothetical protein
MATPHVTGTVALLLERNGCLTPTEIKNAINNNAINDSFTGSDKVTNPDNTWGHGKLDALAAALSITASSCQPDNPTEDAYTAGPSQHDTDSSTSSGCASIVKGGQAASSWIGILFYISTLIVFVVSKHSKCHSGLKPGGF